MEIWDNISSIQGTVRLPKLHVVLSELLHLLAHQSTQSTWKFLFVFPTYRSKQIFTLDPSSKRCTHSQLRFHSRCSTRKLLKQWTILGFFFFSSKDLKPQLCEKATFCLKDQQRKLKAKQRVMHQTSMPWLQVRTQWQNWFLPLSVYLSEGP